MFLKRVKIEKPTQIFCINGTVNYFNFQFFICSFILDSLFSLLFFIYSFHVVSF